VVSTPTPPNVRQTDRASRATVTQKSRGSRSHKLAVQLALLAINAPQHAINRPKVIHITVETRHLLDASNPQTTRKKAAEEMGNRATVGPHTGQSCGR